MEQFNISTNSNETFVTFHGTGGNEYSLLQIVGDLNKDANIRAYIGDVGEGKHRRFNYPLENGTLNREDFDVRVDAFIKAWEMEKMDGKVTFIGYSNGANFILGLLEREPTIADQVILLKPTNLGYSFESGSDANIIVMIGARDPLSIPGETLKVVKQLADVFPNTSYKLVDHGHEITDEEISVVKMMLK